MFRLNRSRLAAIAVMMAAFTLLLMGVVTAAETRGTVAYRVTPGVIGIFIVNGSFTFNNVDINDVLITPGDAGSVQPTFDVDTPDDVNNLLVSYDNATEASGCGWDGDTTAGSDQFIMKVRLGSPGTNVLTAIPANGAGGADVLDATFTPAQAVANLDFQLTAPSTITTGNTSCTIAITVTAS